MCVIFFSLCLCVVYIVCSYVYVCEHVWKEYMQTNEEQKICNISQNKKKMNQRKRKIAFEMKIARVGPTKRERKIENDKK